MAQTGPGVNNMMRGMYSPNSEGLSVLSDIEVCVWREREGCLVFDNRIRRAHIERKRARERDVWSSVRSGALGPMDSDVHRHHGFTRERECVCVWMDVCVCVCVRLCVCAFAFASGFLVCVRAYILSSRANMAHAHAPIHIHTHTQTPPP